MEERKLKESYIQDQLSVSLCTQNKIFLKLEEKLSRAVYS